MSASGYDPKYTSVGEVPVSGPDPWTDTEKRQAIRRGENRLEADINDGEPIAEADREGIHGDAAAYFANYVLVLGAKSPSSMTAGDFTDEGSRNEEFHDHLLQQYKETVAAITSAEGDAGEDGVDTPEKRSPYVYKVD